VRLENLLTFKNGINASKEQYGRGYKFINVLDIINNLTINYKNIIGNVEIPKEEFLNNEVFYGDILFQRSSETREEVGQSNIYLDKEKSCTFGGFVIRGRAIQDYNPVFMNYLFKIPIIRKQITSRSGGSTRYNIGQKGLNQVVVPLPPLKEQKQIAEILSTTDDKLEILRDKKEYFQKLKKGLMQKLLTGEVRVKL
jgi:type I restriction enzyme S subunit